MYQILVSEPTLKRVDAYLQLLRLKNVAGKRLRDALEGFALETLDGESFLERLVATKVPQIFAESAVRGDGSDWNPTELGLLGDIVIAVTVQVFDNGRHTQPEVHPHPFPATLLFVPGALLRNDHGQTPADWDEVTREKQIVPRKFRCLYERRLLPALLFIQATAERKGVKALVTIPGLGCGMFAGPFRGRLGSEFEKVLVGILEDHHTRLTQIRGLYYDPYDECDNRRRVFGQTIFLTRPLRQGNDTRPQLCMPASYNDSVDDFSHCDLYSIVAWDHVSWPGNDFYGGARATDDGVKAAATDVMTAITGVKGVYETRRTMYVPPAPYRTWGNVVAELGLGLRVKGRVQVFPIPTP
ncbi:MAG TPA: hypothetical protein PKO06_02410 [Candidatus Ozemobacteraceae bacterium]|nr:hypothetical protein [Candidatus Ozemobacteraceae bacterium]